MMDEPDFETALRDYAEPVADDGFTRSVMVRVSPSRYRLPVLLGATVIGGVAALIQLPGLIESFYKIDVFQFDLPTVQPLTLTALGILGFIAWAALDRGWTEVV